MNSFICWGLTVFSSHTFGSPPWILQGPAFESCFGHIVPASWMLLHHWKPPPPSRPRPDTTFSMPSSPLLKPDLASPSSVLSQAKDPTKQRSTVCTMWPLMTDSRSPCAWKLCGSEDQVLAFTFFPSPQLLLYKSLQSISAWRARQQSSSCLYVDKSSRINPWAFLKCLLCAKHFMCSEHKVE